MPSQRERILQAIVARLDSDKLSGVTVHRYRTRPIHADKLPAWVVYPITAPAGESERVARRPAGGKVDRTVNIRVELRVVAEPPQAPDEALDPHYVAIVKSLMGEPTLGGLALDIEERATSFDAAEHDQVYAAAATDFDVTYATAEIDPEQAV